MPEKKNGDPLIRTMVVIIVGTIAFGLLFNLFTGGGNMDHMGNMGGSGGSGYGYGYGSLGGLLGGLLVLLIKLLMVVLVIAIIVGVIIWIKNAFFKNSNSKFVKSISNDPILKTVVFVTLGIIGLVVVFALLGSFTNTGMGYGYGGIFTTISIAAIMALLIKVLSFVLVLSLILALVAYVKKQYDSGAFKTFTANTQANTQASTAQSTSAEAANATDNVG